MNKLILVSLLVVLLLPTAYLSPNLALAQGVSTGDSGEDLPSIDSPAKIERLIVKITDWMYTIFLALAVIMIIYAAFVYLTSGGGENVAKAHKMLLYAVVAIAVAMLAKGVVKVVESLLQSVQ